MNKNGQPATCGRCPNKLLSVTDGLHLSRCMVTSGRHICESIRERWCLNKRMKQAVFRATSSEANGERCTPRIFVTDPRAVRSNELCTLRHHVRMAPCSFIHRVSSEGGIFLEEGRRGLASSRFASQSNQGSGFQFLLEDPVVLFRKTVACVPEHFVQHPHVRF